MKKMICMMLAGMLMMLGAGALAEKTTPTPLPMNALLRGSNSTITVQGNASVSAEADIVTIMVNASMTAGTMMDAQMQVSAVVEDATRKLMELGVLGTDIVTTDYGYNPQYSYESDVRRLIGYQASHTLSITCRDVEMLDSVIGVVTDSGMSDIYSVSYDVADRSGLYMQALDLAIRAAKEKADAMAAAGGKTVVGLESLTENQSYDMRYALKTEAAADAAGMNTGIRAGGVNVSASVTAVYTAR